MLKKSVNLRCRFDQKNWNSQGKARLITRFLNTFVPAVGTSEECLRCLTKRYFDKETCSAWPNAQLAGVTGCIKGIAPRRFFFGSYDSIIVYVKIAICNFVASLSCRLGHADRRARKIIRSRIRALLNRIRPSKLLNPRQCPSPIPICRVIR